MRSRLALAAAGLALLWAPGPPAADTTVVRFSTSLGPTDVLMLSDAAPRTVESFLGYVGHEDYDGAFLHRSVKDSIVQGGGFAGDAQHPVAVPARVLQVVVQRQPLSRPRRARRPAAPTCTRSRRPARRARRAR